MDYAGHPADLDEILEIADSMGLSSLRMQAMHWARNIKDAGWAASRT